VVPFGISIASPNQSPASPTERLYVRSRRIGDYRHMKTHVWVLIPVIRAFAVLPCGRKSLGIFLHFRNFYLSNLTSIAFCSILVMKRCSLSSLTPDVSRCVFEDSGASFSTTTLCKYKYWVCESR